MKPSYSMYNKSCPLAVAVFTLISFFLSIRVASAQDASFSFFPDTASAQVGKEFAISVVLDSGRSQTVGADLLLRYDPERLELKEIIPGKLYDTYLPAIINKDGTAEISGVVKPEQTYQGKGVFALFTFHAKKKGDTAVSIEYKPDERNDSNIASVEGKDVLSTVNAADITVSSASFFEKLMEFLRGLFGKKV